MAEHVRFHDATYPELIEAWMSAIEPFTDLAESLTDEQWAAPSVLPGWTNADIVAHVVGIERDLLGDPVPPSDLDWDALPHADDLFSRYTELAVAMRRGVPQAQVCAELRKTIAARREDLATQPGALGDIVRGPGGWELPRGIALRMRCFDIWVHDQDIRAGIGAPGDLGTDAAWVAADRMLYGLARNWARNTPATTGDTAAFAVTGPGVELTVAVTVDERGRGVLATAPDQATVTVTASWPQFTALACGRAYPDLAPPQLAGDAALGDALMASFTIAP